MSNPPEPKTLERSGACGVIGGCVHSCEAYARAGYVDGFETCVCTHTRWSHALVLVNSDSVDT